MSTGDDMPGSAGDDTGLAIATEASRGRKQRVKARFGGELIHSDTLDLHDAAARAKLAKALVAKIRQMSGDGLAVADVERSLLATVESREAEVAEAREA